jgi:hypothetical protein
MSSVKWLASMPKIYKQEIINELLMRNVKLDLHQEYKIVVDILGDKTITSPTRSRLEHNASKVSIRPNAQVDRN